MLEVTIHKTLNDPDPVTYDGIDYVSLVSGDTYGPPPLIAPTKGPKGERNSPLARPGQTVLYINTRFVPMWEIERID